MEIKAFKPGQTVYIMGTDRRDRGDHAARKAEVAKVGRKYVTISGRWGERFRETVGRSKPYLIEEMKYGSPRLLFPSEAAVMEYKEREELKEWVRRATDWDKVDRYTIEQLRAVKQIWRDECGRESDLFLRGPRAQHLELPGMRVYRDLRGGRAGGKRLELLPRLRP